MTQDNKQGIPKRKSLYPPIEVTLDGEVYQSRKFTHPLLIEAAPHEKEIESIREPSKEESEADIIEKKWDAYCNWMRIVFATTNEKLAETEFAEIEDAFTKVKTELLKRQGARMKKSVSEIKSVTNQMKEVVEVEKTTEEIAKNVKRSGEKA